jgi:hypothetical protein
VSTWQLFFSWPDGQVWPNLIASAITSAGTASLIAWRFLIKVRNEHEAHRALLRREHVEHRELLQQQLDLHHEQITKTLRATLPLGGVRTMTRGGEDGPQPGSGS